MSHKPQKQRFEQKRQPVKYDDDAYTESLLASLRSGKEEPDQREAAYELTQPPKEPT